MQSKWNGCGVVGNVQPLCTPLEKPCPFIEMILAGGRSKAETQPRCALPPSSLTLYSPHQIPSLCTRHHLTTNESFHCQHV